MTYCTLKFDSCAELADHVEQLTLNKTRRNFGDSSTHNNSDFYGNWTLKQAQKCAAAGGGWPEGAALMPKIDIPHETLSGHPLDTPQIHSDLQGFAPNIPSFLSGAPDNMFTLDDAPSSDRLLRVAVHVGRVGHTTQDQILNRGAAIMAVLDQLSREGYSIELTALWRNQHDGHGVSIETTIKHTTDHWSPESVAFALCHASFQRRLCWRVAESIDQSPNATGPTKGASVTENGYGNGLSATFPDYDLNFPYVMPGDLKHLKTTEQALTHIKSQTITQLKALEQ